MKSVKHIINNSNILYTRYSGENTQKKEMYKFIPGIFEREYKKNEILESLINNNIIDRNKNIIDGGSFIGDTAIGLCLNINGIVYSIDPGKVNMEIQKELANINNIKNLVRLPYAVHSRNETLWFNKGDIRFGENFNVFYENRSDMTHCVEAKSLDSLYNEKIIENIELLHLDVETNELNALNGSINLIKLYEPLIIFEGHILSQKEITDKCIDFVKKLNYNIYMIDEDAGVPNDCKNFLCVSESKVKIFKEKFTCFDYLKSV